MVCIWFFIDFDFLNFQIVFGQSHRTLGLSISSLAAGGSCQRPRSPPGDVNRSARHGPGMGQAWARHGASGSNGAKLMMSSWSHDVWATFSLHLCISHGLSWQSQSCLIIPSEKNWILWMLESWLGHNHPAVFAAKLLQYFLGNNLTLALAFFKQSSLPVYPISFFSWVATWNGLGQLNGLEKTFQCPFWKKVR